MKRLFIIGNGFDLAHKLTTSYGHFREFLIQNYIGDKIEQDLSCCLPEIQAGPDGGIVIDEREVATFLEKIISLAEPEGEEWNIVEETLGKLDYNEVFDCIPDVYDKDGDVDLWKTSYNNEDMAIDLRETVPYIKAFFIEWVNTIDLSGVN